MSGQNINLAVSLGPPSGGTRRLGGAHPIGSQASSGEARSVALTNYQKIVLVTNFYW